MLGEIRTCKTRRTSSAFAPSSAACFTTFEGWTTHQDLHPRSHHNACNILVPSFHRVFLFCWPTQRTIMSDHQDNASLYVLHFKISYMDILCTRKGPNFAFSQPAGNDEENIHQEDISPLRSHRPFSTLTLRTQFRPFYRGFCS